MNDELDIAAAEYVLGTLPADERAQLAVRLETDAALREAVEKWRSRLATLDETASAELPREEVWRIIEAATFGAQATAQPSSNVILLKRKLALWRGAALAAGALAAALAGVFIVDRISVPEPRGGRFVAVVDSGGHEPALIAEIDTNIGVIRVRSVAAVTPPGKSLELWHVAEGEAPRSLGVLEASLDAQTIEDAAAAGPVDGIIAVSVEPEGGSPSGAPTGPIVYTGRLIPVE